MAELGLNAVSLSFGGHPLLAGIDLQIEKGERIGLLGRNGCGKSTLLKVLQGELLPDDGGVARRQGLRSAALAQEVPDDLAGTVAEQLAQALEACELADSWEGEKRCERVLGQLGLERDAEVASLSAGTKRRVLLARALVQDPDLLMLDEPTNHLDVAAIQELEEQLLRRKGALVFVTHDRAFLRRVATRILDLDRGRLRSYSCGYEIYLERKSAVIESEENANVQFDKKLAQEEAWLRRGVKARRTRNQGRVRALQTLRDERGARREQAGTTKAKLHTAERSGKLVLELEKVSHSFDSGVVIDELTTTIMRADRVGIIGPNGCGKTTLISIMLDEREPTSGTVRRGTKIEVGRFDQLHSVLDDSKSVQENVCDHADTVTIGGHSRHIVSYMKDFLFTPEQARGPIWKLSGGERNRLQLARLMARPCNLLVLDEPTNDLDIETLELLEGLLLEYKGTLLIVSHDREFLDNVVTSTLVFTGGGQVQECVGGYADWMRTQAPAEVKPVKRAKQSKPDAKADKPRRLKFGEKHELEALPARIEELETEKEQHVATMGQPEFYKRPSAEIAAETDRLRVLEADLLTAYARWEELESLEQ
jgi:ATP-binding cassette subfamily F protein uup